MSATSRGIRRNGLATLREQSIAQLYQHGKPRLYTSGELNPSASGDSEGDMTAEMATWRFERGDATATEIQDVAQEVLAELREPGSEASTATRSTGLEPAALTDTRAEVTDGEQGAEPVLTTILVGIAVSGGSKVAETLWKDVLWPRIRRRLGARALGAEKVSENATEREG